MEFRFDDERVTEETMNRIMQVQGVNRHTLTGDACREITAILKLKELNDVEDLRAVRNSVVRYFGRLREGWYTEDYRDRTEKYDFKKDMEYGMWTSATTAVIDHRMFAIDPTSV